MAIDDLSNTLIAFTSNGTFSFDRHLKSKVRCPMDFTFYPHDLQYCVLRLQSCGFDYSFVNFTNPSVYMNPEAVESPSFQLVSVRSSVNLVPIRGTLYSECDVTIVLQRKLNYFIYQVGMCTLGSFSELYYSES